MGKINNTDVYEVTSTPANGDILIGSKMDSNGETVNFDIEEVLALPHETLAENVDLVPSVLGKDNVQDAIELLSQGLNGSISPKRIISGGVIWDNGLTYKSINLVGEIYGVQYIVADDTEITLSPAPSTGSNKRKDIIYLDDTGNLGVAEGDEAETPLSPNLAGNQLYLTEVLLNTNDTTPSSIEEILVWSENLGSPTEWDATENTSEERIDLTGTASPITGTYSIKTIGVLNNGDAITLTSNSNLLRSEFSHITFNIKLGLAWGENSLFLLLENSGSNTTDYINLGTDKIDKTNTTSTQNVTILKNDLLQYGGFTNFNKIKLVASVQGVSTLNFTLDDIQLYTDTGVPQTSLYMTQSVYDPNHVEGDVFDMDNMVEGDTNLILTSQERADIASAVQPGDITKTLIDSLNVDADTLDGNDASAFQLVSAKDQNNGYAGLDANGKIATSTLPPLAITKVITAAENTLALFAAASAGYTFEEGDVVMVTTALGDVEHYIYKGGTKTDVAEYSQINSSQIDWSQIVNWSATKSQFNSALSDGDFVFTGDITKTLIDGLNVDADTLDGLDSTDFVLVDNFIPQLHIAYGNSYDGNFRERMLNLGATYFPNEGGYRVALHRYLGVEPSLLLVPAATAVSNAYLQLPKDTSLSLKCTRASTATDIDEWGERVSKSINEPRISYLEGFPCLLVEATASTNLFLNSGIGQTLVTQNVTTSATTYTVSFYGTGTITFSGTYTGSLVGTGSEPKNRVSLTFTATAGTLTCTVSGSVVEAQIEALSYMSSFIPTTGSTATRSAESFINAGNSNTFNNSEGVMIFKARAYENGSTVSRLISISDGTTNNRISIGFPTTASNISFALVSSGVIQALSTTLSAIQSNWNTIGVRWKLNDVSVWINGVSVFTDTLATMPIGLNTLKLNLGDAGNSNSFNGKLRLLEIFKTYQSDANMAILTANL